MYSGFVLFQAIEFGFDPLHMCAHPCEYHIGTQSAHSLPKHLIKTLLDVVVVIQQTAETKQNKSEEQGKLFSFGPQASFWFPIATKMSSNRPSLKFFSLLTSPLFKNAITDTPSWHHPRPFAPQRLPPTWADIWLTMLLSFGLVARLR